MLFPKFWLRQKFKLSILSHLLFPFSLMWLGLNQVRFLLISPSKSPIPVICVGNITVGGNGKTPTALKLRSILQEFGYNPHILSRGYKSKLKGPHLVDVTSNTFIEVGDEPLMMAQYGPTWISRNRRSGISSALSSKANVIILDDGFQNYSIKKDLSILVIDTSIGFGNGRLLPAGPLRERISSGLKKADLIITIGEKLDQLAFKRNNPTISQFPTIQGRLIPKNNNSNLKGKNVVAFAGIAHPEKFRNTLETLGAHIISFKAFTNHKPFKTKHLKTLITEADKKQAILITTEKDLVRIPENLKSNFQALKIELEIKEKDIMVSKLQTIL